jgi:hypothetical protein
MRRPFYLTAKNRARRRGRPDDLAGRRGASLGRFMGGKKQLFDFSVRSSRLSLKPAGERRTRVLAPTKSRYRTGHGRTRQISAAYSEIVRSLENFPDPAVFSMLMRVQSSCSPCVSISRSSARR